MTQEEATKSPVLEALKDAESKESVARSNHTATRNRAEEWVINETKEFVEKIGPVFSELGGRRGDSRLYDKIQQTIEKGLQK